MKKNRAGRKWPWAVGAVVLAVLLAAGAFAYCHATWLRLNGESVRRDTVALDLRGQTPPAPETLAELSALRSLDLRDTGLTPPQYDALRAALPDCAIRWSVPVAGQYVDSEATRLTLDSLSEAELPLFAYLPALREIDAAGCRDYAALLALSEALPDCAIRWTVEVGGGEAVPWDAEALTLEDADAAALLEALPFLPRLARVTLTGETPENAAIAPLLAARPDVAFYWEFELYGRTVSPETEELDLSGTPLASTAELEAALPFLPALTRVDMCDCGVPDEEMAALGARHPGLRFVWRVHVGVFSLRTDETAFIAAKHSPWAALTDADTAPLRYCTDLVGLDLGHMLLTDCAFVEDLPNLEFLILADNPLRSLEPIGKLEKLRYLEVFMTSVRDYAPLRDCKALLDLNISYTYGADVTVLYDMPWLERLWFCGAELGYAGEAALRQALPDTEIYLPRDSSTGGGWREHERYYEMRDLFGMYYMVG